jgi:putative oxidoreductase
MATMLVAIVTVHRKVGFFIFLPGGGWEYCALIAVVAAAASIAGAGHASVDRAWGILQSCSAGWMGVLGGVSAAVVHLSLSWRPGNAQA